LLTAYKKLLKLGRGKHHMAVFTERQAIQQRLEQIKEERKELTVEYHRLLDRLSLIDAHERETLDSDAVLGSLMHAVQTLKDLVPFIPPEALITQMAQLVKDGELNLIDEAEKEVAPAHIISHQQHFDANKHLERQPKPEQQEKPSPKPRVRIDKELQKNTIKRILIEHGVPMKLDLLTDKLKDELGAVYSKGAFQNLLVEMLETDEKFERPMRGFYQYRQ
jgi:hypothetical protein